MYAYMYVTTNAMWSTAKFVTKNIKIHRDNTIITRIYHDIDVFLFSILIIYSVLFARHKSVFS